MRFFRQGLFDWWVKIFEPAPNESRRIPTEVIETVVPMIPALSTQLWDTTAYGLSTGAADANPINLTPVSTVGKKISVKVIGLGSDDPAAQEGVLRLNRLSQTFSLWRGSLPAAGIGGGFTKYVWVPPQPFYLSAGDALYFQVAALAAGKKLYLDVFGVFQNIGEPFA